MANRWSPTVVAEAPPPVRSGLSRALDVGYGVYQDRQQARRRAEAVARQEQERREDLEYRARQEARIAAQNQRENAVGDFSRGVGMLERGFTTEMPTDSDDTGGSEEMEPREATQFEQDNQFGVADFAPRRAGNSGPGGAVSESQPQGLMAERDRIKKEARLRYPGSGTIQQRDPVTGQTYYLPVRRQWEDAEFAKAEARDREMQKAAAGEQQYKNREMFQHGLRMKEINERGKFSRAMNPDAEDPDEALGKEFGREISGMGTDIDDLRTGISADSNLAKSYEMQGKRKERDAAQASAARRADALRALEAKRDAARQGGVEGYRDRRVRSEAGAGAKAITDVVGQDLARLLADPNVPAAEKARAQQQYQAMVDKSTRGTTQKYKSGLGRAM